MHCKSIYHNNDDVKKHYFIKIMPALSSVWYHIRTKKSYGCATIALR